MDFNGSLQDILAAESRAVANIPLTEAYQAVIDLIHRQVCERGGKVVTSGMGKAGHIAANLASTFASTGIPAVSIHPTEAQHGDLGVIQPNDMLVLVSNSGQTVEILQLLQVARVLYPQIPVVAITGDETSPLARDEKVVTLFTGNPAEIGPFGLTPTTSITTMTVICHLLVVGMMHRTGFSREQYAVRHQGGALGAKLREMTK